MKILFATDGSDDATCAARFLSTLQCHEPVSLTVLTITYAPDAADSGSAQAWFPEWQKREIERVDAHHAEIRPIVLALDKEAAFERGEGDAARKILQYAKQEDVDLIVLGARGHSAIGRILLGSVSDSVATHAECSVLIVRPNVNTEKGSTKSQSERSFRITLAYDGSESSKAAAEELHRFRWDKHCRVNVLSVVPQPGFVMSEFPVLIQEHNEAAVNRARLEVEKLTTWLADQVEEPTSQVAVGNHIGEAIIANTTDASSHLIVMGDTGRGFLGTLMLGSVSRYVLRHAASSVWISRHHARAGE